MPANYTIREVTTATITVDFDNGQWAVIPITKHQDKEQITSLIGDFLHAGSAFDSADDVPFEVGDTGLALSQAERQEQQRAQAQAELLTYRELRAMAYPSLGDQLDAIYWHRQGVDEPLQALDEEIKSVKSTYPKDLTPITRADYDALVNNA